MHRFIKGETHEYDFFYNLGQFLNVKILESFTTMITIISKILLGYKVIFVNSHKAYL